MEKRTKIYYLPIEHTLIPNVIPDKPLMDKHWVVFNEIKNGIALEDAIDRFNRIIEERKGIIMPDGQILSNRILIADVLDYGINLIDIHGYQEIPHRKWDLKQKAYFEIENPYQFSEDDGRYSYGWIAIGSQENYLLERERILALLHGETDERPFYCTCHSAQVVLTDKNRFVCMQCGKLHCVLDNALNRDFTKSMRMDEWFNYFDPTGDKRDEVDFDIVDFQEIENVLKIWVTDDYEESANELIFFSRSSLEELEEYRRTSANPEVLIEAGWQEVPQLPEPAYQRVGFEYRIDKLESAMNSLQNGVYSYQRCESQLNYINSAALQIFHTIELMLKLCLEKVNPRALVNKPNNKTVIKFLQESNIAISSDELETIDSLRLFRNSIQHDEVTFNYRSALKLLQKSLVFIDRFSTEVLGIWIAESIDSIAWQYLLKIKPIRSNAIKITGNILEKIRNVHEYEISICPKCKKETLIREINRGSLCLYCRHRPTLEEIEPGIFGDQLG